MRLDILSQRILIIFFFFLFLLFFFFFWFIYFNKKEKIGSFSFVNHEYGVIDMRYFFIEKIRLCAKSPREVNVVIYIWPHQYLPDGGAMRKAKTNHNIDLYTVIKSPYLTKAKIIQEHKLYLYPMFDTKINFNDIRYPPPAHWYVRFCRNIIRQFIIYPFRDILSLFRNRKR